MNSLHNSTFGFTVRRYASAVYPVVCLSVTSRHCTNTAKKDIRSRKQRHTIAKGL